MKVEVIEWDERARRFLFETRKYTQIPEFLNKLRIHKDEKKWEAYGVKDVMGNWHVRNFNRNNQLKMIVRQNANAGNMYSLFRTKDDNKNAIVVEGLHDAVAVYNMFKNKFDIICLNSVSNVYKAIKELEKYKHIYIATDNDAAFLLHLVLVKLLCQMNAV